MPFHVLIVHVMLPWLLMRSVASAEESLQRVHSQLKRALKAQQQSGKEADSTYFVDIIQLCASVLDMVRGSEDL